MMIQNIGIFVLFRMVSNIVGEQLASVLMNVFKSEKSSGKGAGFLGIINNLLNGGGGSSSNAGNVNPNSLGNDFTFNAQNTNSDDL